MKSHPRLARICLCQEVDQRQAWCKYKSLENLPSLSSIHRGWELPSLLSTICAHGFDIVASCNLWAPSDVGDRLDDVRTLASAYL